MGTPSTENKDSKIAKTPIGDKEINKAKSVQDPENEEDDLDMEAEADVDAEADEESEDSEFDSEDTEDDMPNDSKWNDDSKQVRGTELKAKMEQSERDGEDYRATHQGPDIKQ